jgi:lipooligosaccharide transport system permease protein
MTAVPLRVVEAGARVYRRTWRGSVISAFVNPVLYLLAMGVGLGRLVDESASDVSLGLPYLTFLAPGLLAATAMQTGAGDASYPVMAGIKWRKTYHAVLATPIGVRDLVLGHLGWVTLRLVFVTTVFAGAMTLFGASTPLQSLLAVAPAVLTGLTFAALVTAYTARLKNEAGLASLFRFGIVPLFLFSETFFPLEGLPSWVQPVALASPLWHGVQLVRAVALELPTALHPLVHLTVLLGCLAAGLALTISGFRKRLVT